MARPRKKIDEVLLEKLTKLHLSDRVIADAFNVSVDTIHRHYAEQMKVWRSKSKCKIAEVLFDEAMNKREPWALKAIAQRHLGYSDRQEIKQTEELSPRALTVINDLAARSAEFFEKNK